MKIAICDMVTIANKIATTGRRKFGKKLLIISFFISFIYFYLFNFFIEFSFLPTLLYVDSNTF